MSFSAVTRQSTLLIHAMPKHVFVAFALILAIKLGTLFIFGPASQPDTSDYVRYADAILSGEFRHVDLAADPMPITLTRTIGYPAVIAAAKVAAGRDWDWAVVLFQFAVSLLATAMVYRLARAFGLSVWLSIGVAAAQATSMQFVIDQAILTDSLTASALTIATCALSGTILRRRPYHLLGFLGVGGLITVGFLMRPVVEFLAFGFVPLAAAAATLERSRLRRAAAFAFVFVPLAVTHYAYTEWNQSRVGAAVVTAISQTTLLEALIEASRYDPTFFSGSSPIDEAMPRALQISKGEYNQKAEQALREILYGDYGWDAIRMSHEATRAYLSSWRDHPYAMIRHTLMHISETQLHQAVRPIETIHDVILWNTGKSSNLARERVVRAGDWRQIPAVIVSWIVQTISVFVFLGFAVVTPIRLIREGWNAETSVSIGIWCCYMAVGCLYAAVHLEPRYLTPVVAGSIVVGTVNIVRSIEYYRQRPYLIQSLGLRRSFFKDRD